MAVVREKMRALELKSKLVFTTSALRTFFSPCAFEGVKYMRDLKCLFFIFIFF